MIYEFPGVKEPIKQGDIFADLPRIELSLKRVIVTSKDGEEEVPWEEIVRDQKPITAIVGVKPVTAIVATQDCDIVHAPDITLCEIRNFSNVYRKCMDTKNIKGWVNVITQHARINLKWFYLPPDKNIKFEDRMGIDFLATLRIRQEDLESYKHFRRGRLNKVARAHFRERIADFFRRYAYDEWYPLNRQEFDHYKLEHAEAKPYEWQETKT